MAEKCHTIKAEDCQSNPNDSVLDSSITYRNMERRTGFDLNEDIFDEGGSFEPSKETMKLAMGRFDPFNEAVHRINQSLVKDRLASQGVWHRVRKRAGVGLPTDPLSVEEAQLILGLSFLEEAKLLEKKDMMQALSMFTAVPPKHLPNVVERVVRDGFATLSSCALPRRR